MCGIAGIFNTLTQPAPADLHAMVESMHHRGPNSAGYLSDGPLAMGMRRLSIIDLESGQQPIGNEDGSIQTIFNGEIFNYLELRAFLQERGHRFSTQTDTEVIVHLYEEEGLEFLKRLNGMFAIAIWDSRRQRLVVARDRLGVKPLYYAQVPGGILFASELKALLASKHVATELDIQALFDYFVYQYIPGEQSPFRGIRKLLPGHLLVAEAGGLKVQCWWRLADHVRSATLDREEATAQIRAIFLDAVRLRMRSDVPVGAFLSGGLDSSLVAAAAASQTALPFSTFSIGFARSEFDELPFARALARHAGTRHHELTVSPEDALAHLPSLLWHMDEPNSDTAFVPSYLVSRLAAKHVTVALSGLGGDELFGGYGRYLAPTGEFARLAVLPKWFLHTLRPLFGSVNRIWGKEIERLIDQPPAWCDYLASIRQFDEPTLRTLMPGVSAPYGERVRRIFESYPGEDRVNRLMYVDAHNYLPDQILALTDRMSMAVSLEVRTPFLDYRLVELLAGLPGDWKVQGANWKIILKDALGDLVPASILTRPKWGFASPVRTWMQAGLLQPMLDLCHDSRMARAGLLDRRALERFVASPATLARSSSWLWVLGVLEIWYRIFCEPDGKSFASCNLLETAAGRR